MSRQNCSLKTASRIRKLIRKIHLQKTNGNYLVREAKRIASEMVRGFNTLVIQPRVAYA